MKVEEYWHGTIKNYKYDGDVSGGAIGVSGGAIGVSGGGGIHVSGAGTGVGA